MLCIVVEWIDCVRGGKKKTGYDDDDDDDDDVRM